MRNRGRSSRVEDGALLTIQKDVEDLEAVRRHFKVEKFVPVGYSYLGFMVVLYAMAHQDRVERLVQLGPVPRKFGTEYPASLHHRDSVPVSTPPAARLDSLSRTDWAKDHQRGALRGGAAGVLGAAGRRSEPRFPAHEPVRHAQRVARESGAALRVSLRRRPEARRASGGGRRGTRPRTHHSRHLGSECALRGGPRVGDDAARCPADDRGRSRPPGRQPTRPDSSSRRSTTFVSGRWPPRPSRSRALERSARVSERAAASAAKRILDDLPCCSMPYASNGFPSSSA